MASGLKKKSSRYTSCRYGWFLRGMSEKILDEENTPNRRASVENPPPSYLAETWLAGWLAGWWFFSATLCTCCSQSRKQQENLPGLLPPHRLLSSTSGSGIVLFGGLNIFRRTHATLIFRCLRNQIPFAIFRFYPIKFDCDGIFFCSDSARNDGAHGIRINIKWRQTHRRYGNR